MLSTPVIRAIKKAKLGIHLVFLTESESAPILAASPHLDELIVWERQYYRKLGYFWNTIRDIRAKQFDTVIDLQGSSRTALIALLTGASTRIGFNYRGRSLLYTSKVSRSTTPKYGPAFKLDILKPLGINSTNLMPEFHISELRKSQSSQGDSKSFRKDAQFTIVISPVSRRWYKRWPLENFAELTEWLIEEFNAHVILLCGPGEAEQIDWIADKVKSGSVARIPVQTLFEAAAHLENSDLLVSN
ncbi:MAG: glycosyltransferase family 9 protein, partial [candidate division Zixibacteria bacterium]|nr:glycosyltransferase family 9 protein [candidate division Zixibacteria bacterium]